MFLFCGINNKVTLVVVALSMLTIHGKRPPNIVFFLVDDLGYTDIGAFGSEFYETPNIDQLSRDGMLFKNGYAVSPICSPTRASILLGTSPGRHHISQWIGGSGNPDYVKNLPLNETTLPEALKRGDYKTGFFGKWHLNYQYDSAPADNWPDRHGFDLNVAGHFRGGLYIPNTYFSPWNIPNITNGPPGEYMTDRLAAEASSYIEKNKDDPFLVYFSFYSVHNPLAAPSERISPFTTKKNKLGLTDNERYGVIHGTNQKARIRQDNPTYAAMVKSVDMAVGRILNKLDELNLTDETFIVFYSDNGGLNAAEGLPTSNAPYKAGKGWVYEGGIKVPLIIKWPGVVAPGSKSDALVTSMDFYPTILEVAGLDLLPEQHKDGVSLLPILKGERPEVRSAVVTHYPHLSNQQSQPATAIRLGNFKLINHYMNNINTLELFDLSEDIREENNLVGTMPELRDSLLGMIQKWASDVGAEFPSGYRKIPGIRPVDIPLIDTSSVNIKLNPHVERRIQRVRFLKHNSFRFAVQGAHEELTSIVLLDVRGKKINIFEDKSNCPKQDMCFTFADESENNIFYLFARFGDQIESRVLSRI